MRISIVLMAAALAGCDGGGAPRGEPRSIKVTGASDYEAGLKAASDFDRGMALRRAVMDSGSRCKSVEESGYQQPHVNMSMWAIRCSDGGRYALFIAPNGDVQVRRCADAAQLKLPECRFDEAAGATPAAR